MSNSAASNASSTPVPLLPYEGVQECSKALSAALDSLSDGLSDRSKSAYSAMGDEIMNWDHTQIWEHPSAPYTQHFRDSIALLKTILSEDPQGDSSDPGLAEAHEKLKGLEERLTVFDGEVEALEHLTIFRRAEYASRITLHLVDCRIADPLSSQFMSEAEDLYESFGNEKKSRGTIRSARNRTTWRDNIQDLRTALESSQASEDQEARKAACKSLDILATAADEIESIELLRQAVTELLDDVCSRQPSRRRDRRG